jgi:hypothetical protein
LCIKVVKRNKYTGTATNSSSEVSNKLISHKIVAGQTGSPTEQNYYHKNTHFAEFVKLAPEIGWQV